MKVKRLVIIIIISQAIISCKGQAVRNGEPSKPSVETLAISQYHTFIPPINFEFISHSEGLPKGFISDIIQTNDGFVWIYDSNQGLIRYDGYHYSSPISIKDESTGIAVDNISRIVKSSQNGLWLVSEKGLVWFDGKTFKSKIIPNFPEQFLKLTMKWGCIEDQTGQLWIFGKGLYLFHPATQLFKKIDSATNGITGATHIIIDSILQDNNFGQLTLANDGSIWLGGAGITHIIPKTKVVTYYPTKRMISQIIPDSDNSHVWTDSFNGLSRYNFRKNSWLKIVFKDHQKNRDIKTHPEEIFNSIYALSHIENRKLWMANAKGIKILDVETFRTQVYNNEGIMSNSFNRIVKGINSTQWLQNDSKLLCNFSQIRRFTYHKILPENEEVISYVRDKNSDTEWFGTVAANKKGRLYKYSVASHEISSFDIPVQPCSPFVLIELNDHELLVGTGEMSKQNGKLYRFNKKSHSFQPISRQISGSPTLTTDSLEYLGACRDQQNNIWLSVYKQGLLKYEINTNQFQYVYQNLKHATTARDYFLNRTANGVFCSENGFVWIGGLGGMLNKINTKTGTVEKLKILSDTDFVKPLCENLQGEICISTLNGIALYNTVTRKLFNVPGMPRCTAASIDSANNIIAVGFGNLWFYNSKLRNARVFDAKEGIEQKISYYGFNNLNLAGKNELLIGDTYRFPLKFLYPKNEVPPLHLTSIKILGKELADTGNVDGFDQLVLKHDQNQLSLEFAALSFLPRDANVYSWMLQGVDTGWQKPSTNNVVTYASLTPGQYIFKVKTVNQDGIWGEARTLPIEIVPAFWQTMLFKVLLGAVIVALFYWVYKNRLNQINLRNQLENEKIKREKKDAEFQRRLADLTLSALRSQINPHFIFNCLNSIKLYATQNDAKAASEYLTKFSRLLRKVLDNTRNATITLSDELEVLQLYIEMEAMRFKEKLKYTISVDGVDSDYIEIPPLLLQPYVENAIWHGLMNKEGGGTIEIKAFMKSDSTLLVTIKDDGIGRAKASELKSKTGIQHKSFGMEITSERVALINEIYKTATSIVVEDLTDEKGSAAGTQVIIQIEI